MTRLFLISAALFLSACTSARGPMEFDFAGLAPVKTGPALSESIDTAVWENRVGTAHHVAASHPAGKPLRYAIASGADADAFRIDEDGRLYFRQPPDYEAPGDVDGDNTYQLDVVVSDGEISAEQQIRIGVKDGVLCPVPDRKAAMAEYPASACPAPRTMFTRGPDIRLVSGDPFIARGINLQYGDDPETKAPALRVMSEVGANIVRLQLRRDTSADELEAALVALSRQPVITMVMFWEEDTTGGTDTNVLLRDVEELWLTRWMPVLRDPRFADRLMINVVNEWGEDDNDYEPFLSTYETIIARFREERFRMPIVIDAPHYGQYKDAFLHGRAERLLAADRLDNLVFSLHAYNASFDTTEEVDAAFAAYIAAGFPWLWGEFGGTRFEAETDLAIDHHHLLERAQEEGIGWIAWSWKGNGPQAAVLDMSRDYGAISLTTRGEEIVNGPYGLKATSVPPSQPLLRE